MYKADAFLYADSFKYFVFLVEQKTIILIERAVTRTAMFPNVTEKTMTRTIREGGPTMSNRREINCAKHSG